MRKSSITAIIGVSITLIGGYLAWCSTGGGGGMVVQDTYHMRLMEWATLLGIAGITISCYALVLKDDEKLRKD